MEDRRRVFRIRVGPDGTSEEEIEWEDLERGDYFRVEEPSGEDVFFQWSGERYARACRDVDLSGEFPSVWCVTSPRVPFDEESEKAYLRELRILSSDQ